MPSSTTGSRTTENLFLGRWTKSTTLFLADVKTRYANLKLAETNGLSVVQLQNLWIGPFLWQRGLLGFLRREEIDRIVFLADWKFLSTWTALLLFRRRVTIGWTHGLSKHESTLQRKLKLLFYKRFSHIWTYSEDAATHLRALNLDALAVYNSNGVATRLNPSQEGNKDLLLSAACLRRENWLKPSPFVHSKHIPSSPAHCRQWTRHPTIEAPRCRSCGSRSSRVSRRHLQRNRTCDDCPVLQPLSPPHRHRSFCAHSLP